MVIKTRDETKINFGRLSDEGVMSKSPFSRKEQLPWFYNDKNFQYLIDNIADIFGYSHGTITAYVEKKDRATVWIDSNNDGNIDKDEIHTVFKVNGAICVYERISVYGKHFMFDAASKYGNDVVVGIVAHEVGHMVAQYTLNQLETRTVNGSPQLCVAKGIQPYWEELIADYIAGIVLAISNPSLSQTPLVECMRHTVRGEFHPDGYWRVFAIEMGYQWGRNNDRNSINRILTNKIYLEKLLCSFFENYYKNVYTKKSVFDHFGKSDLPNSLFVRY